MGYRSVLIVGLRESVPSDIHNRMLEKKFRTIPFSQSASVHVLPYIEGVIYTHGYFLHAYGISFQCTGRVFLSNTTVLYELYEASRAIHVWYPSKTFRLSCLKLLKRILCTQEPE